MLGRRDRRAREGARGSERPAGLPASQSRGRARRRGSEGGARRGTRVCQLRVAVLRGSSTSPPSLPSPALRPGVSGRGAEGRDERRGGVGGGESEVRGRGVPARGEARVALDSPASWPPPPARARGAPGAPAVCSGTVSCRDGEPVGSESRAKPAVFPSPGRGRRPRPGCAPPLLLPPSALQLLLLHACVPPALTYFPAARGRRSPAR